MKIKLTLADSKTKIIDFKDVAFIYVKVNGCSRYFAPKEEKTETYFFELVEDDVANEKTIEEIRAMSL